MTGSGRFFHGCGAGRATGQTALFCRRRRRAFVFATASDSDVDPRRVRLAACDRGIYAWGLRRADRVVTQHATQAEALRRHYGVDSTPIAMASPIPRDAPVRIVSACLDMKILLVRPLCNPRAD